MRGEELQMEVWNQVYNPFNNVTLSTIAAAVPVVTLLVLIASGKVQAHIAAIIALVLANLVAIFGNARVELLLSNAIGYGLNAVAGAVKGKTLDVDVGNQVLAAALQYAVDNAPGWLQSWAGGPEGLAKKIWARLNLGDGADDSAIPAAVASVTAS